MSDDDFMMEDEGDFDFDYEEEDGEDGEQIVDLENIYYNSKASKEDEPEEAIKGFNSLVEKEEEQGEWGFKALKQLVKIHFRRNELDKALEHYQTLLTYTRTAVTRNYSEKSINNILDLVSSTSNPEFMEAFYDTTLKALEDARNERLWMRTNLKLAKMWLDRGLHFKLETLLRKLHKACQTESGTDDQSKGTHLLEVYALEIQMHTQTRNNKKLKDLYMQCMDIKSAIPHPRIMGIIRECGAKMYMSEGNWQLANTEFFESFRLYDEAGSFQRIQVLKYLVLANMLSESEIDPFDSQETKPYRNDPQITVMTNLVGAYQRKDLTEFQRVLNANRTSIMDDAFIRTYLDDVILALQSQALVKLVSSYSRVSFQFISEQLNISTDEVQRLLVNLILDEKLKGEIDQVNQRLELFSAPSHLRYAAFSKWINSIKELQAYAQRQTSSSY
ncbi:hypothetical protein DSO57_1029380 [Entomophthora muscae]|uniref:Uncharacterized protein n=1 Tax=Entomophthora muscae TaxID=34485 RepID=A0ACC2TMZ6_9FUNG|nr:hypothetical protein DSO57_1029380 [Entomophthora muscae]